MCSPRLPGPAPWAVWTVSVTGTRSYPPSAGPDRRSGEQPEASGEAVSSDLSEQRGHVLR
jgi:hypothetical protein